MGLICVFVGCIFLFNPSHTLIDILPDIFGVIFIMYGISKAADLDNHLSEAMRRLKYAFWVALGKFVCLCIIGVFDSTMIITLSLAFGVLECVFLIPALTEMFGGLEFIAMRHSEGYRPPENDIKTLTVLFIIIRAAGAFVPDMAAMLSETAGGSVTSDGVDAVRISAVLSVLFSAVTLAVGALWLFRVHSRVLALRRDAALIEKLTERYTAEILENSGVMLRRKVGRFTMITSAGLIFFITFRIESVFFMPEFLFGAAVITAMFFAKEYGTNKKARIIAAAFTAVGAANYAVMIVYSMRYGDLIYPFGVKGFTPFYAAVIALNAVTYALFAVCMRCVTGVLRKMTRDSVGIRGAYNDERRRDVDSERVRTILRKLTASDVLTYIYAATALVVTVTMPFVEAIWLIKFAAGIILFVQFAAVAKEISNEASNAL